MKLWTSEYELRPRMRLSSRAGVTARHGALLRVESSAGVGHADLHPWEELGDAPLNVQLEALVAGEPTLLGQRALCCVTLDAQARALGRPLYEAALCPPSHFLWTDTALLSNDEVMGATARGFTHIKLKVGHAPLAEAKRIRECRVALAKLRLRLDANAKFSASDFIAFVRATELDPLDVDFVEDPCVDDLAHVRDVTGLRIACDRLPRDLADVWVAKPAIEDVACLRTDKELVVTSYAGHAIGSVYAACVATRYAPSSVCGLVSHEAYERDAFSEAIATGGPKLCAAEGTGLGFDAQLERCAWKRLR